MAWELVEEADRMAVAEVLAEGWAVAWELVTGLSEAAAGRTPPRGILRLAAVDVARVGVGVGVGGSGREWGAL